MILPRASTYLNPALVQKRSVMARIVEEMAESAHPFSHEKNEVESCALLHLSPQSKLVLI